MSRHLFALQLVSECMHAEWGKLVILANINRTVFPNRPLIKLVERQSSHCLLLLSAVF